MKNPSEAETRKQLIDPALKKAGWRLDDKSLIDIEIPVDGYDAEPWNGISDYILKQPNGEVLAVVEAKRQSRDARLAQQQAEHYVTEIEKQQSFRPVAFLTNGKETYYWDGLNLENKRLVHGFFSQADLLRHKRIQENGLPLAQTPINDAITNIGLTQTSHNNDKM